jgi:cation/acetate symporter
VGALLNFLTAFIVSKITAAPPREVQELVESIRVPKGAGKATAH